MLIQFLSFLNIEEMPDQFHIKDPSLSAIDFEKFRSKEINKSMLKITFLSKLKFTHCIAVGSHRDDYSGIGILKDVNNLF